MARQENITDVLVLLHNAIDFASGDEHHSGYTTKELHRKAIVQLEAAQKKMKQLEEDLEAECDKPRGWKGETRYG